MRFRQSHSLLSVPAFMSRSWFGSRLLRPPWLISYLSLLYQMLFILSRVFFIFFISLFLLTSLNCLYCITSRALCQGVLGKFFCKFSCKSYILCGASFLYATSRIIVENDKRVILCGFVGLHNNVNINIVIIYKNAKYREKCLKYYRFWSIVFMQRDFAGALCLF